MTSIEAVLKALPSVHGWCSDDKAMKLFETIVINKMTLAVEIGVFGGSSFLALAAGISNTGGKAFGIDPWEKDASLDGMVNDANREFWGGCNYDEVLNSCRKWLDTFDLSSCSELIRSKAEDVVYRFDDFSIDLLHIDGNHSEGAAYKDATLYLPKVKTGGVIFFDDIFWTEVGNQVTTRKALIFLKQHCDMIDMAVNRENRADCMILRKR